MGQKITLKAARVNKGLKTEEAAHMLGISLSTLRNWENYKTFPTYPNIVKICNLYNVNFDSVIFCE